MWSAVVQCGVVWRGVCDWTNIVIAYNVNQIGFLRVRLTAWPGLARLSISFTQLISMSVFYSGLVPASSSPCLHTEDCPLLISPRNKTSAVSTCSLCFYQNHGSRPHTCPGLMYHRAGWAVSPPVNRVQTFLQSRAVLCITQVLAS